MILSSSITSAVFFSFAVLMSAAAEPPKPAATATPSARAGSLSEYAKHHSIHRDGAGRSTRGIEINDENLKTLSGDVELTAVSKGKPVEAGPPSEDMAEPPERQKVDTRECGGPDIDPKSLDRRIAELWEKFYACDDPALRDREIRPRLNELLSTRTALAEDTTHEGKAVIAVGESQRDSDR